MGEEKDQDKPLAPTPAIAPSHRHTTDEEDPSKWLPSSSRRKLLRRRCVVCCGCCTALLAVIAVLLLVLSLTVYKVRDPEMTLNSITIEQPNSSSPSTIPLLSLLANSTVVVDVSVKNPNPVSYYFDSSTSSFYYKGLLVGVAHGPSGKAAARRTYRLNVTVEVAAGSGAAGLFLNATALTDALAAEALPIDASTEVGGHVKILGLVRHHVEVVMNCTVTVAVANLSIVGQSCRQRVWT